ncbi:uncharacterized protein LOC110383870 isoform X2 [Helicoverpa armigera]|uniref:uncharacterized protein LOC110383870 isoform X2 n=1 Tax=Helicoverpa armigera TaxID=29058 RepID=UPI003082DDBB
MSNRAWVTLATNDSYGLGALVLAHSLRRVGSSYPAVVLITPSVTDPMRDRLRAVFAEVIIVDVLDSQDAAHLALLQRPELGITFTKIHCWNLTQYDKCVFLDADTLVVQNCDELFEREQLSAAPDVGWPDCFNSGVFVFSPSADTFSKLITFAQERGSFDGGDQGLLNSFFSDWAHGDIKKHLPFLYNVTSAAFYSYLPALKHYGQNLKIIHFIGAAKPWLQQFNFESGSVDAPEHIRGLLQLWWDIFVGDVHSQLDTGMVEVAEALDEPLVLPPHDVRHEFHYQPTPDPESEFAWHHPDVQAKEDKHDKQIDVSEFHDPWTIYRGHIPPIADEGPSQHVELVRIEDHEEIRKYAWDYQAQKPPSTYTEHKPNQENQPHYTDHWPQHTQHEHGHEHHQSHWHHDHNQSSHDHHVHHSDNHGHHSHNFDHQSHQHSHHGQQSFHSDHHGYQSYNHVHHEHHSHNPVHHSPNLDYHDHYNQSHDYHDIREHPFHHHDYNEKHSHDHHDHQNNNNHDHHSHNHDHQSHSHDHHNHSHEHHEHKHSYDHQPDNSSQHIQSHYNIGEQKHHQNYKNHESFSSHTHPTQEDIAVHHVHVIKDKKRTRRTRRLHRIDTYREHEMMNGDVSATESDDYDDIMPRHPYDGFYLRHRVTVDARGRKVCTHEIPPTPTPSPPDSPVPIDLPEDEPVDTNVVEDQSGVAGNLARVLPGGAGNREALDELSRRQGWEAGNIDYMGADSFANIWAKISQTLSKPRSSPPKQSPPREPAPQPAPEQVVVQSGEVVQEPVAEQVEVAKEVVPAESAAPAPAEPAPAAAAEVPVTVEAAAPVAAPAPAAEAKTEEAAPAKVATPVPEPAVVPVPVETAAPAPEAPAPAVVSAPSEVPVTVEAVVPDVPAPVEALAPVAAAPAKPEAEKAPEAAAVVEAPKTEVPVAAATPEVAVVETPATPASPAVASDSPPLANTPSKEEAPAIPAAKTSEEAAQETRL